MKHIKFFQERKNLKENDLYELVEAITYEQRHRFENVFEQGDHGEHFYIILKGIVLVKVKNPTIKQWKQERARFKELLDWKNEYLEPKIDRAIKQRFEVQYKLRGKQKSSPDITPESIKAKMVQQIQEIYT